MKTFKVAISEIVERQHTVYVEAESEEELATYLGEGDLQEVIEWDHESHTGMADLDVEDLTECERPYLNKPIPVLSADDLHHPRDLKSKRVSEAVRVAGACECGCPLPHHLAELGLDAHVCQCERSYKVAQGKFVLSGREANPFAKG